MTRGARPIWLGPDVGKWDHCRIHFSLLDDERLGAVEIAVYVGLVRHADHKTGKCHPSVPTLAKYVRASENSVRKAIRNLLSAGYVDLDQSKGGTAKTNTYWLKCPPGMNPSGREGLGAMEVDNLSPDEPQPFKSGRVNPSPDEGEQEPLTRTKNEQISTLTFNRSQDVIDGRSAIADLKANLGR